MPRPDGATVKEYSYRSLWDVVTNQSVADRINVRASFAEYLTSLGHPQIIAEEYAEKNLGLIIQNVLKVCENWESLGIPRPLEVVNQSGAVITWKHPRFSEISGRPRLPSEFCGVWSWVRGCLEREFLFCCAAYLFLLGCQRIFITDVSGDGGVDVLGIREDALYKGVCFVIQAKTAQNEVTKESLFSDYTKYMLLRYNAKWGEYKKSVGLEKSSDGLGLIYMFVSNQEFNPSIVQAARDLPIMLRSGRQIAHGLCSRASAERWKSVRESVGEPSASLERNVATSFSQAL